MIDLEAVHEDFPPLPPLEDQSGLPVLLVHMGDDGRLSWKPDNVKGARWRGGCASMGEVCEAAEESMPNRYALEYVESKE